MFIFCSGRTSKKMKKQALVIIGIVVAALAVIGLYFLYLNVFVNKHQLDLVHKTVAGSEYRTIASDSSIMPSYMWRRMESILMDGDYLMSDYMLEGRLATQEAEPSDTFLLKDQSYLLLKYLADGNRSSSRKLVKRINEDFLNEDGSYRAMISKDGTEDLTYTNSDELAFLEAYIEYYSAYGDDSDLARIKGLIGVVFDEAGMIRPEPLKSTTFGSDALISEDEAEDEETYDFSGVKISDVNLELIANLERNGLIREGVTDRYSQIVLSSLVSPDIPYYAYAYYFNASGVTDYVYSGTEVATVSVEESLKTMINLARADLLSDAVYYQFKTNLINDGVLYSSYYLTTGLTGGEDLLGSYCDILALARYEQDTDLFRTVCRIMNTRVATKQQSRALYLVFRSETNRYVFYSSENIRTYLNVNGMFAV